MAQFKKTLSYSGNTLKEIRLSKGIKLDDVTESTKITKRHLLNIEEENFLDLPERVYFKGFLASYAKYIGVNEGEVLKQILDRFDKWEDKLRTFNEEE